MTYPVHRQTTPRPSQSRVARSRAAARLGCAPAGWKRLRLVDVARQASPLALQAARSVRLTQARLRALLVIALPAPPPSPAACFLRFFRGLRVSPAPSAPGITGKPFARRHRGQALVLGSEDRIGLRVRCGILEAEYKVGSATVATRGPLALVHLGQRLPDTVVAAAPGRTADQLFTDPRLGQTAYTIVAVRQSHTGGGATVIVNTGLVPTPKKMKVERRSFNLS